MTARWTTVWTAMPQVAWAEADHLPPAAFASFHDTTLRQTVRLVSAGEAQPSEDRIEAKPSADRTVRLRLCNAFGTSVLSVSCATVAVPVPPPVDTDTDTHPDDDAVHASGSRFVDASTLRDVTFSGQSTAALPAGGLLVSDPVALPAGIDLTISLYFAHGLDTPHITIHPGSRTQSWLCRGDATASSSLQGDRLSSTLHWYFLAGVDELTTAPRKGLVLLGDSITDGRCSTDNGNDRWPDLLRNRQTASVVLLNQAAGGNCLLRAGTGGPALLDRFARDVLGQPGVAGVLVCGGVNDIGTSAQEGENATATVAARLVSVYEEVIRRCAAAGLTVVFATITPFGGPGQVYSSPDREAARQTVNAWIRRQARLVDFDQILRDPAQPSRLLPLYNSGDHLHPNVAGFQAMADGFPLDVLEGM